MNNWIKLNTRHGEQAGFNLDAVNSAVFYHEGAKREKAFLHAVTRDGAFIEALNEVSSVTDVFNTIAKCHDFYILSGECDGENLSHLVRLGTLNYVLSSTAEEKDGVMYRRVNIDGGTVSILELTVTDDDYQDFIKALHSAKNNLLTRIPEKWATSRFSHAADSFIDPQAVQSVDVLSSFGLVEVAFRDKEGRVESVIDFRMDETDDAASQQILLEKLLVVNMPHLTKIPSNDDEARYFDLSDVIAIQNHNGAYKLYIDQTEGSYGRMRDKTILYQGGQDAIDRLMDQTAKYQRRQAMKP